MGIVKNQINKIKSPYLRKIIKPIYLTLLNTFKYVEKFLQLRYIRKVQKQKKKLEYQLINEKPQKIKVAFLVLNASIWKYDILFQKMLEDELFEPIIFICPHKQLTSKQRKEEIELIFNQFNELSYPILRPYDENNELLDLKQIFQPHLVFFTNPHDLSYSYFTIKHFNDVLTAYAPYSIMATKMPNLQYDKLFHNLLWRMYNETPIHHEMAKKYSRIKGKNSKVAGASIVETLTYSKSKNQAWNCESDKIKIIYAPHHTFNDLEEMNFSTVIENGYFMLEMAKKYHKQIHIAFKPHPLLKHKLYECIEWNKDKTDRFFKAWEEYDNTQIEQGDYTALFQGSDAMILDSISFITEYLFVDKPALFLLKNKETLNCFNEYGIKALENLEWAFNHTEIENFIKNTLDGIDSKKEKRAEFLATNFTFNNTNFSDFIINDIKKAISEE